MVQRSRIGITIGRRIFLIRITSLVSDQPQERYFLGLKAAGSFMYCSIIIMDTLQKASEEPQANNVPSKMLVRSESDNVHKHQASPGVARSRNVFSTVSRQIFISTELPRNSESRTCTRRIFSPSETTIAKQYLRRVSASVLPPSLVSAHGLGYRP